MGQSYKRIVSFCNRVRFVLAGRDVDSLPQEDFHQRLAGLFAALREFLVPQCRKDAKETQCAHPKSASLSKLIRVFSNEAAERDDARKIVTSSCQMFRVDRARSFDDRVGHKSFYVFAESHHLRF